MTRKIRTRFAPSPTGFLHIGSVHTALFNFLFAKKNGGESLMRIEDTDKERSKKEFEADILEGLKWLDLNWDGELIRQSERAHIYKKYLEQLLQEKKAFYCFHSMQELEAEQKEQELKKITYKHDCYHKRLSQTEIDSRAKEQAVIRLLNIEKIIVFNDMIRGQVSFESSLLGDVVIAKDLNAPLYHFAVVVDDFETGISHVIRGEDHISNTPKQILIQEALGFEQPQYAHLPLILGQDKSKLSKRHSSTALKEYKDQGYLAQAMVNFLALLGWHPITNQEIFSMDELIQEFDLERVQKAGAIFDINKLDSINHQYIQKLDDNILIDYIAPYLKEFNSDQGRLFKISQFYKERIKKFSEIKDAAGFIFKLFDYEAKLLCWKNSSLQTTLENLNEVKSILEKIKDSAFDLDCLKTELMPLANQKGKGEVLWPLRVALSGLDKSPDPFELLVILGKIESLTRINTAIQKLS